VLKQSTPLRRRELIPLDHLPNDARHASVYRTTGLGKDGGAT
jgi:hypothetical protein